jgi:hypothetical protein
VNTGEEMEHGENGGVLIMLGCLSMRLHICDSVYAARIAGDGEGRGG